MLKRVRTIPGVSARTAIMLLAECGADMTVFRTPAHLASWAGICPGNNTSGGRSRSGRTRHGSVALRTALTEAAHAAARTKNTYLAAHHAHIRGRRGLPKAVGATRHDLLIAYWHVVHNAVAPPSTAPAAWSTSSNSSATPSPCSQLADQRAFGPSFAVVVT